MHRFTTKEAERVLNHIRANHLITFSQLQKAFTEIGISKLVKILQHLVKNIRIIQSRSGGYFTTEENMSGHDGTHAGLRPNNYFSTNETEQVSTYIETH